MSSPSHQLKGFFITGSDTGVGKTWISCQLIKQLNLNVSSLKVRKPVESGCEVLADKQLIPADGIALFNANDKKETVEIVTPLRFKAVTSPDRAARFENQTITLNQLAEAVNYDTNTEDILLVEGAGGFYSPIAEDGLNADLASILGLAVIIVIEDRLGAINQSLLTIKAVESEGLTIQAVILNQLHEDSENELDNLTDLKQRTDYPIYSCRVDGLLENINLNLNQ